MNTPNPLLPQGLLEGPPKGRSNVHLIILTIVSIHAVFFAGLLMQGCRRDEAKAPAIAAEAETNQNTLPPLESEYYPATQDMAQIGTQSFTENDPSQTSLEPVVTQLSTMTGELPPEGRSYKIVKGDTLSKIAKVQGVTLTALMKANPNVNPSKLKLGATLAVPAADAASSQGMGDAEQAKANAASDSNKHRVKAGETLTHIARQHGVTVKAIRAANNMSSDRLLAGQEINLPARAADSAYAR